MILALALGTEIRLATIGAVLAFGVALWRFREAREAMEQKEATEKPPLVGDKAGSLTRKTIYILPMPVKGMMQEASYGTRSPN